MLHVDQHNLNLKNDTFDHIICELVVLYDIVCFTFLMTGCLWTFKKTEF